MNRRRSHGVAGLVCLIFALFALSTLSYSSTAVTTSKKVDVDLRWVEVNLGLTPDGKASVVYKIRYRVNFGPLHGFYFEGTAGVPHWDRANSVAIDSEGNRYGLDINNLGGGKWDVILSNGAAIDYGEVTYILVYGVDLLRYGNLGKTESEFGTLVYLNWAPVQWDEPLEHETVYVHYPVEVSGSVDLAFADSLNYRTERFMNEQYLIDYRAQEFEGKKFFTVVLHRENISSRYHFQIQQYINADIFPLLDERQVGGFELPGFLDTWRPLFSPQILMLIGMSILSMFLNLKKHFKHRVASSRLDQLNWLLEDWVPPKIEVSHFRKEGKIAELNIYEAGIICDIPISAVLAVLIGTLEQKGFIEVLSTSPLSVRRKQASGAKLDEYESQLLGMMPSQGYVDREQIKELLTWMSDSAQRKAWDCDLEATKTYYLGQFRKAASGVMSESDLDKIFSR